MSEINNINQKYSSLQRIHETCALQLQESESRCRYLEATNTEFRNAVAEMKGQYLHAKSQADALENKNTWSIGQMDKLQGQVIEATSQFKKMEELFINRDKTVENFKKDLRELTARYDALKIEYDIMTDKFEERVKYGKSMDAKLVMYRDSDARSEVTIKLRDKHITKLKSTNDDLEKNILHKDRLILLYRENITSKNVMIEKYKVYLNDIHPHIRASLSFIGLTYFVYVLAGILRHLL